MAKMQEELSAGSPTVEATGLNPVSAGSSPAPPTNDTPQRETHRFVVLGETSYTVARLGTRDGLSVARSVLRKIQVLKDPILELASASGTDETAAVDTDTVIPAVMTLVEALVEVLDEDELIGLTSKLLGLDPTIIADAPLEDSLNAIADAFEMNNMSSLLNAARRIWDSASKFVNNR